MSLHKLNVEIMRLVSNGIEPAAISLKLETTSEHVNKIIIRDKSRIKDDSRSKDCLELYRDGYTLEEIGQKYKITRERARQIIKRQVGFEMGYGPLEQEARKGDIDLVARSIVVVSRKDRLGDTVKEKIIVAEAKGIEAGYFDSVRKYCGAIGVTVEMLRKGNPDIYELVRQNERVRKRRWSRYYDQCRQCGTITVKHQSLGYCRKCYGKSPEFKSIVQRSNLKNRAARQTANKKYLQDYYSRPEIIEKMERDYDERYFGGNRKAALERDGHECLGCRTSIHEKDAMGRPRVRVWHLKDNNDHSLDNLGTYCQSCLFKSLGGGRWHDLKQRNRS
jgi:hypothetical protein